MLWALVRSVAVMASALEVCFLRCIEALNCGYCAGWKLRSLLWTKALGEAIIRLELGMTCERMLGILGVTGAGVSALFDEAMLLSVSRDVS